MMEDMEDKAAFPSDRYGEIGMTLRDYFAAQAMSFSPQSFEKIAGIAHKTGTDHKEGFLVAAKFAYQIADAMLKARGE
jgi:hypothetical protein